MAWRIKCPPARPRIGKRSRGGGSPSLGIRYPRGWRRPLRPRGRRRLAAGGPSAPRPAKQKAGAGGFAPAPAFQGALRPAAAPLRRPRRGPLSAGNVADAPRKRGASAKTPPGDGSKPNIPPFGNVAHGLPLCQHIQQEALHAVPVGDPQFAQTHVLHQVN